MFPLLLASWLQVTFTKTTIIKETTLNAQISSKNGASIIHDSDTVIISNTNYIIQVPYQHSPYDLKLSLNNSWSFKQYVPSTITLKMDGFTPFPHLDTDLLIVFAVGDLQYFSFFIHLDAIQNIKSRIYPSLSIERNRRIRVSEWIDNEAIDSRWDRISNNGEWITMHDWNQQVLWPLKFVIMNDPISNTAIFRFYHNISIIYCTQYTFDTNFVYNEDIDVYIMGDSIGERYEIYNINMKLNKESQTIIESTINPSITPTNSASYNPTDSPSNNPTKAPTINPSISPSNKAITTRTNNDIVASINRINSPSIKPTIHPLISSSRNPTTENPSKSPTSNPSIIPSINPTKQNLYNYGVIVTVKFDYKFSDNDINIIINILKDMILRKECIDSEILNISIIRKTDIFTSTIINIVCDDEISSTKTKLEVSVNNDSLRQELVQNINKETDLRININKTDIEIDNNQYDIIINKTVSSTMYINNINNILFEREDDESIEPQILLWMVKLIALQLILCCLMTICIFIIKLRTKHLKVKHSQINKMFNKVIQEIYGEINDNDDHHVEDDNDDDEDRRINEENIIKIDNINNNKIDIAFNTNDDRKIGQKIQTVSDSKPIIKNNKFFPLHSNTTTPNHKIASSSLFCRSQDILYEEISETQSHAHSVDILRDKYNVDKLRKDIRGHIIISDHNRYPSIPTTINEKTSPQQIIEEIPQEITMSPTITFTYPEHLNKLRRHGLV